MARTFTLTGWEQSVVVEMDDGSTVLTLTDADGGVTVVSISGDAEANVALDARSAQTPRPAAMAIEAASPELKES